VKFTGLELAGAAELVAPVEKVMTGPVEKAEWVYALEKRAGGTVERKTGCRALARRRCRATEWRRDGEGDAVEREARWRAPSPRRCCGVRSWRAIEALR
jgi:hypothetical protein